MHHRFCAPIDPQVGPVIGELDCDGTDGGYVEIVGKIVDFLFMCLLWRYDVIYGDMGYIIGFGCVYIECYGFILCLWEGEEIRYGYLDVFVCEERGDGLEVMDMMQEAMGLEYWRRSR